MLFQIALPWPDEALWPNNSHGQNFRFNSTIRHNAQAIAEASCFNSKFGILVIAKQMPISWTFIVPNRHKFDIDGAHSACKKYQDGIAAFCGINDSVFRPVLLDSLLVKGEKGVLFSAFASVSMLRLGTAEEWMITKKKSGIQF